MKRQSIFIHPIERPARITQWLIGKNDVGHVDYRNLLLPTLAWQSHHNNERWITWIASQFIERSMLEQYNVNLSSLRMIVDSHSNYSSFKLLLTALKNNRSSMVIASLPSLSDFQQHELEQAAEQGDCQALLLIH
jgi:cell division inhibitor SulA